MKSQAVPYFMFNGNAAEALEFYKEVFEGEIFDVQTYGEADFPSPPEAEDLIIHGRFKKGELFFMVSDAFPGSKVDTGNNISFALELEGEEEIQRIYQALAASGTVIQKLQDTFWGARYAKVKDKFGIIWDLNYPKQ